jgi:DNA-binding MarR family transcriptional regulator
MKSADIEQIDLHYSDTPPVLIGGNSDAAIARAARTIEAAGGRVADAVTLGSALQRIERQIAASAVWLELDSDAGASMDDLLDYVNTSVADRRFGAVVSTSVDLIDPVAARITEPRIELIVDADDAQRMAALAVATAHSGFGERVADIASDQSAARLRQLSDEVSRIAATLARLSAAPGAPQPVVEPAIKTDAPEISAETVRAVIRARRLRSRYFAEELFADPAWDMLLDLLQAEIGHLRVPVSSLCIAAAVPATTALRWLKTMVSNGLFVRRADPHDGRRVFVELAPETSQALRRYFAEVGTPAVI